MAMEMAYSDVISGAFGIGVGGVGNTTVGSGIVDGRGVPPPGNVGVGRIDEKKVLLVVGIRPAHSAGTTKIPAMSSTSTRPITPIDLLTICLLSCQL